jgi:hypothetical protein
MPAVKGKQAGAERVERRAKFVSRHRAPWCRREGRPQSRFSTPAPGGAAARTRTSSWVPVTTASPTHLLTSRKPVLRLIGLPGKLRRVGTPTILGRLPIYCSCRMVDLRGYLPVTPRTLAFRAIVARYTCRDGLQAKHSTEEFAVHCELPGFD